MAFLYRLNGKCVDINSYDRPEIIIKWGIRLLYLTLFLSLMVVLNLWHIPITLPYVGAIMALILTALFVVNNKEAWEEYDDQYLEDISQEVI